MNIFSLWHKSQHLYIYWMQWYLDGPAGIGRRKTGWRYRSPILASLLWLLAFLNRLFCWGGLFVIPPMVLFLGHTFIVPDAKVREMLLVAVALLVADWVVGALFWPWLKTKRSFPEHACVGQEFCYHYEVYNRRHFPALFLIFECGLRMRWFMQHQFVRCSYFPGKKALTISGKMIPKRRGIFYLRNLVVSSVFPFGICKHSSVMLTEERLIVHPAFFLLDQFHLPVGKKFQKNGSDQMLKINEVQDFTGCRDYRDGDNPRHIHWPSSARRGRLVVKEYKDEFRSRAALIVDTYVPHQKGNRGNLFRLSTAFSAAGNLWKHFYLESQDERLEAAITLAASIVHSLMKKDFVIDFFAAGREMRKLSLGRQTGNMNQLLDLLAGVEAEVQNDLGLARNEILEEAQELGAVIVILLSWDEKRADFIRQLRANGVAVKVIMLGKTEVSKDCFVTVNPSDILSGKIHEI
ncbi:MAG: DUF58 domain-containing protein [Lentisphaeria bacterium]